MSVVRLPGRVPALAQGNQRDLLGRHSGQDLLPAAVLCARGLALQEESPGGEDLLVPPAGDARLLCDDGRIIFAFKGGLAYYDPENGPSSLERIADFEPDLPTRMNDGRVDPMGRFVVGGYNASGEKISSIYRLDPATMKVETLLEKVACTNSICFTGGGGGEGEGGEGDGGADGDGDGDSGDDPAKKCAMYFTDSMAMPRQIFRVGDYGTSGGSDRGVLRDVERRRDGVPVPANGAARRLRRRQRGQPMERAWVEVVRREGE